MSDCQTLSYRAITSEFGLGSVFRRTRNGPGMGKHGIEIDPKWVQQDSESIPVESTKRKGYLMLPRQHYYWCRVWHANCQIHLPKLQGESDYYKNWYLKGGRFIISVIVNSIKRVCVRRYIVKWPDMELARNEKPGIGTGGHWTRNCRRMVAIGIGIGLKLG